MAPESRRGGTDSCASRAASYDMTAVYGPTNQRSSALPNRRPGGVATGSRTSGPVCPLCGGRGDSAGAPRSGEWVCADCGLRFSVEANRDSGSPTGAGASRKPGPGVATGDPELDRWLSGEPIVPRSISPAARFMRWCRARPVVTALSLGAALLVFGAAIVGLSGFAYTSSQLAHARQQRQTAEQQREEARQEAERRARLADERRRQAAAELAARRAAEQRAADAERQRQLAELERQAADQRRIEAERRARIALAEQLAQDSEQLLGAQPYCSLFLASEAVRARRREGLEASLDMEQLLRDAFAEAGVPVLATHGGPVRVVAVTCEGRRLIAAGADARIEAWDLSGIGRPPVVLRSHRAELIGAAAIPGTSRLATADRDGTVMLWDFEKPDPARPVAAASAECRLNVLAVSPDGRWLLAAGGRSGTRDHAVRAWPLAEGKGLDSPALLRGHSKPVLAVALTPDGRWAATAGEDRTIRLWSLQGRYPALEQAVLEGHEGWVGALCITPDGRTLISGSYDGTIRLWDLADPRSARETGVLQGHQGWITALAVDPSGRRLASGSFDRTIRVWDLSAADPSAGALVLSGHTARIQCLAFTPDGSRLVSASLDATARLWTFDPASGQPQCVVLRGHKGPIEAMAVTPDGRWLVTGAGQSATAEDNSVRVWDLNLDALVDSATYAAAQKLSPTQRQQLLLESARRSESLH